MMRCDWGHGGRRTMLLLLGAAALVLVAGASWGSAYPAGERAGKVRPEAGSSPEGARGSREPGGRAAACGLN